jgi:hypothetical protein
MSTQNTSTRSALRGLLISLVINVGLPLLIIRLLTQYQHTTELTALSVAAVVPLLSTIVELVWHRRLDIIAIFYLLGTLTSIVAIFLGGDARLLIIRESFFTGALGLVCLLSLLMPRPLMFYVGRQMLAGNNATKLANFNAGWQQPYGRFVHRLITAVWGVAYIGEFIVRVILAYTLPPTLAFAIGSTLLVVVTAGAFLWTFAYIRHSRQRFAQIEQANANRETLAVSPASKSFNV